MANLINSGIMPLTFDNEADYDKICEGDELEISGAVAQIEAGGKVVVKNKTKNEEYVTTIVLSARQKGMILEGGLLNYTKSLQK